MPLEKPSYRDNLERICEAFPSDKCGEFLNIKQVVEFTGISYPTATKLFSFNKCKYISKATLAREMS